MRARSSIAEPRPAFGGSAIAETRQAFGGSAIAETRPAFGGSAIAEPRPAFGGSAIRLAAARRSSDVGDMAFSTVGVLGAGTMGQGIAQVFAASGAKVRLYDVDLARVEKARTSVRAGLDKLVAKGKIAAPEVERIVSAIGATDSIEAASTGADVVVEAIPEDMALKVEVLRKVVAAAPREALLGSNTSSLSITELGNRIGEAGRTIGLHFFNPPPVMELLEIVRGLATTDDTVARAKELAKQLGKTAVLVNDTAGFATSRLGVLLGAEAMRMVESGVASAADIDRAMELGYRHPMGPLKLTDLVGLDVRLAILEHLQKEIGEQFRPPPILRKLVRAGHLGKKTGRGFYVWTADGPREP